MGSSGVYSIHYDSVMTTRFFNVVHVGLLKDIALDKCIMVVLFELRPLVLIHLNPLGLFSPASKASSYLTTVFVDNEKCCNSRQYLFVPFWLSFSVCVT